MIVLFADFDGVLNSKRLSLPPERAASEVEYDDRSFDKEAVERLNRIVERTGCEVVVSSSWRHMYPLGKLCAILRRHGYRHRLLDVTIDDPRGCRGDEIAEWLARHPVERFAIVDDNSDMGPVYQHLVQTSFDDGLLDEHVDHIVAMLT